MILFVLFAVLLALVLEKVLIGRDLERVEGDHRPDQRVVEPGQVFSVNVTLRNDSRRFVPFLRVSQTFDPGLLPREGVGSVLPDGREESRVEFTAWLRPRQKLERSIPVSAQARGRYLLRQFKLTGGDFLGLREQTTARGGFHEVVAAPLPAPSAPLAELLGGFMGEVSVRRFILEDPVLTLGFREYTGREPMKSISWPQSARSGRLMVNNYDYTAQPTVSVLLNVDTPLAHKEELLERCCSLARTVCAALEERGVKYDFTSNATLAGAPSDPGAGGEGLGERHFAGVLEHLGRATGHPCLSVERLLEKESRRRSAAGRVLITPGGESEGSPAFARLREAAGGCVLVIRAAEVGPW